MKKMHLAATAALALAVGLSGCGGAPADTGADAPAQEQEAATAAELDFDGSGMSDTGAGSMILRTAGGTTEDGNVPEVANPGENALMSISLEYSEGDGSVCSVYIDGMEYEAQINADEYLGQYSIALQGDWVKPGTHKVEVVAMDGETATVYKSAEYEIAE